MTNIDARGKNCPIPVIMTKKAIEGGANELTVLVDNKIATQNLEKLANNSGLSFSYKEIGSDFEVTLLGSPKAGTVNAVSVSKKSVGDWAVFITEKGIGTTDNELGSNLLKMYLYTLTQTDDLPGALIFMNEGVKVLENEEMRQSLSDVAIKGVKLVFCGTCLNFYGISHLCAEENVSNMYDIVEEMAKYSKVVKL